MEEKKPLLYKGKMLTRIGNKVYYGNLEDKFIIVMEITSSEMKNGFEITTSVTIALQTNTGSTREKVLKKVTRDGMGKALDIAEYWLEEALTEEN